MKTVLVAFRTNCPQAEKKFNMAMEGLINRLTFPASFKRTTQGATLRVDTNHRRASRVRVRANRIAERWQKFGEIAVDKV